MDQTTSENNPSQLSFTVHRKVCGLIEYFIWFVKRTGTSVSSYLSKPRLKSTKKVVEKKERRRR